MNGPFLNALGILLGALFGMTRRTPLPAPTQQMFRIILGVGTIFCGGRLLLENLGSGFLTDLKRIVLAGLAVFLGFWLGKLLHLQGFSNKIGRQAGRWIASAQKNPPGHPLAGLAAGCLLFGAAPLGWLGAVENGFTDQYTLFALKGLMDALAMSAFVKLFGWPCALSAFPIFGLFTAATWLGGHWAAPFCAAHQLTDSVKAAAGLVTCLISVVIFEVRKVELANYLPAVVVAPLLEWLCG